MSDIDNAAQPVAPSEPVAPPQGAGEQPGSTPASVDTTASETAEPGETPEQKQSRRDSRAFASQRRQINELQREIGRLTERIEASRGPGAEGGDQPTRSEPTDVERLRSEMRQEQTARTARLFWDQAEKEAKDKGIAGLAEAKQAMRDGDVPTNPVMSHYVTELAENKAAMVVWLADNPDEAERIAALDPLAAGVALAKADARLSAKPAPKTTKAPPPVPTVGGRSTPEFDPEKASMDEYAAHWHKRRAG